MPQSLFKKKQKERDERSIGEDRPSLFLEATWLSFPAYSLFEGTGT